ncbi:MAG: TPM domain-containing protein [Candidatus Gracilibacteria bacterium]|nr:TPM domain-containing protein [Candidatus Gracilibacteria bacterium]
MKKIILIFLFCLYFFSISNAFDIKDLGTIDSYVIDKVGVLDNEEKSEIEKKIIELKTKYTTELLTVIIDSTKGEDISSVATQIGQDLGVGKADKDNGVVILIAIEDRAWNISTGYGVEGVLPDILANRIGENNFSLFRENRYKDGIIGALNDFDKAFSGDESIISEQKNKGNSNESIFILVIISFLAGIILFKPIYKKKQYKKIFLYLLFGYIITLPIAYFLIGTLQFLVINAISWVIGVILGIGGKIGNGGGGKGGGSGGGSFGGFGGGGFGGGGSSGKW